ncbi:hypothetical protein DF050_36710 [Burkholderia cepacia]|nr:hypothetical protein DF050_36710 [Burkholderia cepacia]
MRCLVRPGQLPALPCAAVRPNDCRPCRHLLRDRCRHAFARDPHSRRTERRRSGDRRERTWGILPEMGTGRQYLQTSALRRGVMCATRTSPARGVAQRTRR